MRRDGRTWIMAVYFPRGKQTFKTLRDKFAVDLMGISANSVDGMAFVCNQEISLAERGELLSLAGGMCDIYHLERVVTVLDQPKMQLVRAQFLNIDSGDAGLSAVNASVQRQIVRERIDTVANAVRGLAARNEGRPKKRNYFVVQVHGLEGFYAQFMRSEIGIYVELVSSRFLASWHRLSQTQEELLVEHGWEPPDERFPNFHRDFVILRRPSFAIDLARKVLDTLIHVYGVHETDPLVIRTSYD